MTTPGRRSELTALSEHVFTELTGLESADDHDRANCAWSAAVSMTGLPAELARPGAEPAAIAAIIGCGEVAFAAGALSSIIDEALAAAAAGLALAYREALGP